MEERREQTLLFDLFYDGFIPGINKSKFERRMTTTTAGVKAKKRGRKEIRKNEEFRADKSA